MFVTSTDTSRERAIEDRQLALEYLSRTWFRAEREGVDGEALAHAALFAAFATLVKRYGEEAAADFIARLPERIRAGEYTVDPSVQ